MIEELRTWFFAVTAVSLLTSMAQTLVPEGTLRRIAAFVGGTLLLVVLVRPMGQLSFAALSAERGDLSAQIEQEERALRRQSGQALCACIEERTAAYIEDKAAALGIVCTAKVTARQTADGVYLPDSAVLSCPPSERLSAYMADELGIPRERQVYHGTQGNR